MNIVICTENQLIERCEERGYKLEEVVGCIKKRDDKGRLHVDTDHKAYPKKKRPASGGVGTELSLLLKKFGISAKEGGCSCRHKSKLMDKNGVKWNELNIDTVVGWMRENSKKMKIPFVAMPARMLVRQAIKNARRKGAKP
jgi:hypothetical protein